MSPPAPRPSPLLLMILDGYGEGEPGPANAITLAEPQTILRLRERYPWTTLRCSGEDVGLPAGLMGNSEVGHLNIGAGRIVWQEITRIDRAIRDGSFFTKEAFLGAAAHARKTSGTVHLMGLCSDGGVHSSLQHLYSLLRLFATEGFRGERVCLHAFLDGRDTPPRSGIAYVADIEGQMAALGTGRVATVCGRYWAMDRDKRWDRVARAWHALTLGDGETAETAAAGIERSYARGEGDEFVQPFVVGSPGKGRIRDGDACIFFNFRADRARELSQAFLFEAFDGFPRRVWPKVWFATMTRYRDDFPCPVAFLPTYVRDIMPELVSRAGLTQLRIAETEKYAHVTFFFSGGDEKEFPGERRVLVQSPKVATYDLQPAMSADELTDRLLAELDQAPPDFTLLNFANADMVGHTGLLGAAVEAVKTIDRCIARIVPAFLERGGRIAITADHGNVELMVDPVTGQPHTAHTTNPVPFILAAEDLRGRELRQGGRLGDIAPTLLPLLDLAPSPQMEGRSLL